MPIEILVHGPEIREMGRDELKRLFPELQRDLALTVAETGDFSRTRKLPVLGNSKFIFSINGISQWFVCDMTDETEVGLGYVTLDEIMSEFTVRGGSGGSTDKLDLSREIVWQMNANLHNHNS